MLVSCPRNKHIFRCDQNGPPARREEGAYLERYVTDEQRRRPIFIATLWAAASWLFFRVARSSRIDLDMIVARALKNSQLTCGERRAYFGDRTLGSGEAVLGYLPAWLWETENGNLKEPQVPYPADQMRTWEISPRVNSPKNDDFHIGSLTVTVVPSPDLLSTKILPPCRSTQCFTITRPRPVPGRSPTL